MKLPSKRNILPKQATSTNRNVSFTICSTLAPTAAAKKEAASCTKGGRGEIRNVKGHKRRVVPRGSSVEEYIEKNKTRKTQ